MKNILSKSHFSTMPKFKQVWLWSSNLPKKCLLIFAFSLITFASIAQCTIKGVLLDEKNGEAIPFATILLEGTNHGATTDLNGFFLINKIPDGDYTLLVRYVGYEDYRKPLTLSRSQKQTVNLNIQLKPAAVTMKEVVITESRAEERKSLTSVSVEKITSSQIQQMPSIGGQADLAQYLQVLPGVNSTGDQGGQLYIRGGSMIQNLALLDGMIVYNPFHSIGLYSIFETDIILNANIYTGGFGAEYGGRLSSVMDIVTRDGNKKRQSGKIGFNTFGANLILEGPIKKETATSQSTITYLLSAKNSYLSKTSPVLYSYIPGGLPFDFTDLYGKLSINSGSGSKINFFGFRFDDKVIGYQALADYNWLNYGAGGNFVLVTGSSSILDGSLAYSNYRINLKDASHKDKFSSIGGFNASINLTNFYGRNRLKYGISMEGYATDYSFTNNYGLPTQQAEHTNNLSIYAAYKYNSEKWLIDPGIRFISYTSLMEKSLEPRLAIKYNYSDKLRFKFAGGLYSQIFLDARSDNDIVNLFNGFLTGSGSLDFPSTFQQEPVDNCIQKAKHAVLGAEYDITSSFNINAEAYIKVFDQLLNSNHNKLYSRNDPSYAHGGIYEKPEYYLTDFMIEKGLASGFDVSLCYDIDRLYVWATYSLGWVTRTDEIQTYYPHYDRRHTVNLLATYTLGDQREWEFSARWNFGSGYPFTQTQGAYENIPFTGGMRTDYTCENGSLGLHYGELYAGRMPNYHRFDIGVKRKFSIGKRSLLELNLSVTNLYSRENIFYFDRITFERINQLPVLACFGVNFTF